VAEVGRGLPPPTAAASPAASTTASLFGGLRGGRPRNDGLVPGSPQAIAADREKDRLRKQRQRDREAAAREPAALPSAVAGAPVATPGAVPVDPGLQGPAPIPWDAEMLKPLFEQLLPAAESLSVEQITNRAVKARLPADIIEEIETEAKWSKPAKKALEMAGPQATAKWLNRLGISSENQAELVCGTALASILAGHALLLRRLNKLIELANVPVKPGPPPAPAAAKN